MSTKETPGQKLDREIAEEEARCKKAYELMKDRATVPAGIEEMAKIYATDSKYARKLLDLYHQAVPT